jgi:signal transduction histidine kinase
MRAGSPRSFPDLPPSAEMIDFSVEDTGLGISPDALDRLFQLFTQADSTIHQKYGGTGIGLAVTHQIVEAHGGTVDVDTELGRGTRMIINLPSTGEAQTHG